MAQLCVNHLDLLLRVGDFRGLERLEIADIFSLEVLDGGCMLWVETSHHGSKLVVRWHCECLSVRDATHLSSSPH